MKHSRISLLERAAEMYDFGSALRTPVPPHAPHGEGTHAKHGGGV